MSDENVGLIDMTRPKGAHLFRVYSMKNRERFEFYYRTQLIEWVRLEFDAGLIRFVPVNKVFKTAEGRLFVAFKLVYLNSETLVYFAEPGTDRVVQAFEEYCSALGMLSKILGREIINDERFEVWNRFKILSFIVRWKDEITDANLKLFVFSLSHSASCALSNFDRLDGFGDGRGLAFALELVRIGKFNLPSLREQLIGGSTIVVCSSKGDAI
ncbi:hypothetical protein [Pseudomonas khavaziana]|uniref:hypothetical protein n=1 Tax=Pseudomonas khavaziana TaxID=2842351 RepID=UPI001C3C933F|nr:hypothetical protein [Pseudomonas khavaziana]MBV4482621.1 hypothetical protein [Pseudomonas khavaziana]